MKIYDKLLRTDSSPGVRKDHYEAFGEIVSSTGESTNNRLANTKERDFSIGLDNHGFRYYDPETGCYISRDPIGYGDGMNVYRSVSNNPINHIDPLGLSWWRGWGIKVSNWVRDKVKVAKDFYTRQAKEGNVVVATVGKTLTDLGGGAADALRCGEASGKVIQHLENEGYQEGDWRDITLAVVDDAGKAGEIVTTVAAPAAAKMKALGAAGSKVDDATRAIRAVDDKIDDVARAINQVDDKIDDTATSINKAMGDADELGKTKKQKILDNIDESKKARDSSKFDTHAKREKLHDNLADSQKARESSGFDDHVKREQRVNDGKKYNRNNEYPHGNNKKVRDEVIKNNTDANGNIRDPETNKVIPPEKVTIEHKKPVVEHWNEEGFNQTRKQRREWYNNKDNLTVKEKAANSSEVAKMKKTYRQEAGGRTRL